MHHSSERRNMQKLQGGSGRGIATAKPSQQWTQRTAPHRRNKQTYA
jgi:hypothetical protein